jgi:hypothetical protein
MSRSKVEGFDYVIGAKVELSLDEWRRKYPADQFRRRVENGETSYQPIPRGPEDRPRRAAEAYANIPEARS